MYRGLNTVVIRYRWFFFKSLQGLFSLSVNVLINQTVVVNLLNVLRCFISSR